MVVHMLWVRLSEVVLQSLSDPTIQALIAGINESMKQLTKKENEKSKYIYTYIYHSSN